MTSCGAAVVKERAAYAPYQDHCDRHQKAAGLPDQDAVAFAIRAKKWMPFVAAA